jgi:predicted 2-oxoglutarate/Fe(II)-dependent dioxygenase YbiX
MHLRDGVLVQRGAIDAADLKFLMAHVAAAQVKDSLVSNFEAATDPDRVEWVVNKNIRDTQEVELPTAIADKLSAIDEANIRAFINSFYGVEVRDREPSQILHYGVGGHYIAHVDAETLYKDDSGLEMWEKTLDRDLSIVYFLNDDFAGGELVFPALELVIKPAAGTLVCFPSDHHYIHAVNPVTSGHRYTIVTWMRVKGMPSVDDINQMALDEYNRMWPKQVEQPPRLAKGGMSVPINAQPDSDSNSL